MSENGVEISTPQSAVPEFEGGLSRDLKLISLQRKAIDLAWPKGISGRRVDFPQPDGKLVWGVEIEIPLKFEGVRNIYEQQFRKFAEESGIQVTNEEVQKSVGRHENERWFTDIEKFGLPNRIKKIRILDLAPQELLPRSQRNLRGLRNWWHDKHAVKKLTDQPSEGRIVDRAMWLLSMPSKSTAQRAEAMHDLFYDLFGGLGQTDREKVEQFRQIIEKTGGDEILIVHAHGGYDDFIGEQDFEVKGKDAEFQAPGNRINIAEIIDRYDQPEKFGAILINSCYLGRENPPVKRVPIFRPRGFTTGSNGFWGYNWNKTLISQPKKD